MKSFRITVSLTFCCVLLGLPLHAVAQLDAVRPIIPAPPAQTSQQRTPAATPAAPPPAAPTTETPGVPLQTLAQPGSQSGSQPGSQPGGPLGPPAAAPPVSSSYVIGPEDSLSINVWKEAALSGSFTVRPDGMISMPLLGDLSASGLTPMALSADITVKLKKYINEPLVTVTILAVNSRHFYLTGQIARPGSQPLTPGITPMQAIAAAGGLSEFANAKKVYILRTDASGKQLKIPFNYKKAIKDGDQQGVTLQPNDTIVVP